MTENIEVKVYNKAQLRTIAETNEFWEKAGPLVISKNKVLWMLRSPRIEEEDTCLMIGLADEKLIAFIHIIADELNTDSSAKVYWMNEWWVQKEYQDTVLGMYMYNDALKRMGHKVLVKSNAESANEFYRKQPFTPIQNRKRFTIFFSLNVDSIIVKFPFLKPTRAILSLFETISFKLVNSWNKVKLKNKTKELSYEYIHEIDVNTWRFAEKFLKNDLIKKDRAYVSWQLSQEQYIAAPIYDKIHNTARIGGTNTTVEIKTFNVYSESNIIAFISLLSFGNEAYIKYFLVSDNNFDSAVNALIENCIALKRSYIFTDNEKLAKHISKNFTKVFVYNVLKTAWAHNSIDAQIVDLKTKEQDGQFV
ncbi:GNAT family N-acetyltransferase [Costertonia aggregata]|uniref:GNAT family N-acetyltransferase n=1 Tax=Costertonia aggregata TaxID=343403 RepID=A0A7H9ATF6_9FLAO|nr:GNAT family N-acetyltransferase [Costertonia aggregata]QLG46687.1 GNAT family N-acetyltransferase [Costertonia aggregata]